jgi:hypothetical protein
MISLTSQFAMVPHDLMLYQTRRTESEMNEMVLTFPEGMDFLCRHELGRDIQDADHNLQYRQVWDRLRMNSVGEGLPISNPWPMFLRINANSIRQIDIQGLDP